MNLDRTQAPNILNATDFEFRLQPINSYELSNGIPLHYISAGVQEVLNIDWVFTAGIWQEPKGAVAQYVAGLLKNGTTNKTALVINEQIELYGASLRVSVGNDFATLTLSCLSKHAQKLLPLVYELLTESNFPDSEVQIFKQRSLQRLEVNLKKSSFVANRKIDELLFGKAHPYGHFNTKEEIEDIQSADLVQFLHEYYTSGNCKIFVAGKFPDSLIEYINIVFGSNNWGSTKPQSTISYTVNASPEKKHRIINDPKGVQGSIRMAMPYIEKSHPDFAGSIVLNTLFGGYFGSRLMANIREEKGYTYGIYSYLYNNMHLGVFAISTEAGKDVSEAAVAEVYKEIERIKTEPIAKEELQLVKNYILGGLLGDLDGPFQIMSRWKNIILYGFQENRFYDNLKIYKEISCAEIQDLAKKYLVPENFYEVIVY